MEKYIMISLVATLTGIWISHKIYLDKKGKTKLACPRDGGCNVVLHSTHSEFLGIGNETWGLMYFSFVGIFLSYALVRGGGRTIGNIILFSTTAGILYSLHLIYIQAAILRKWCWWCVSVAGANFVLWASVLLSFVQR
jgi:uncharacterized membrane protein